METLKVVIPLRYNSKDLNDLMKDLEGFEVFHLDHCKEKIIRVTQIMEHGNHEFKYGSELWNEAVEFFKSNPPLLLVHVPEDQTLEFDVVVKKHKYIGEAYIHPDEN